MKIANIEFTKEAIIITAAAAAVIGGVYLFVYKPLISALGAKYSECRLLESQVLAERAAIRLAGTVSGERVLMTEKETSLAMGELTGHGKSMGIEFVAIKPGEIIQKEGSPYKVFPVEVDIKGSYKQFLSFLGALDELKKSLATVESFDMYPDKEDKPKLRASIVINVYFSAKGGAGQS